MSATSFTLLLAKWIYELKQKIHTGCKYRMLFYVFDNRIKDKNVYDISTDRNMTKIFPSFGQDNKTQMYRHEHNITVEKRHFDSSGSVH